MRNGNKGLRRLRRPTGEALEAIAAVLSHRWRNAAKLPTRFWPTAQRWLRVEPAAPQPAEPHHFTTGGRLIR